jgi:hypothetical protein
VAADQLGAGPAVRAGHAGRTPAGARMWLWGTVALTAGAIAVTVALAPPAGAPAGPALAYLLFVGSSAHVAATGWFYTVPPVRGHVRRHRGRYLWVPLALITGASVAAALLPPSVLNGLLLPYFAWQFFHYQKQNLGLASLAASAYRVAGLRPAERRVLLAAGLAGIAGLLARPRLLQLAARPGLAAAWPLAAAGFAAAVLAGLVLLARRPAAQRPPGFCAAYLSALAFSLPVFLFGSPYAAVAGMTIAHGLQYVLLVGLVAAGPPGSGGRVPARTALTSLAVLGNMALAGGAVLAAASGLQEAQPAVRLIYGAFLGAVMAHFVVDAGLWRLREPFPRSFLAGRVPYLVPGRRPAP